MASKPATSRVLAVALAVSLVIPLLPTGAVAAQAVTGQGARAATRFGSDPIRIVGKRPYGPPIAVARKGWPTGSRFVVLVSYASKADQLVAGPLAGVLNAPILYVGRNAIPTAVVREIRRLRASRAFVVGNPSRVSSAVIAQLPRAGINTRNVRRLGGSNDYMTARLVAVRIRAIKRGLPGVVIVNKDYRYWATGAVPLAGRLGMPILLTTRHTIPSDTRWVLSVYRPKRVLLVGGTGMISYAQGVRIRSLARISNARMTRFSTRSAYEAASALAEHSFMQGAGFDYSGVVLGSATYLPDPLVAGPWAARIGASLLLVHPWTPTSPSLGFFESHCSSIKTVFVIGDRTAVLGSVLAKLKSAGETVIRPEAKMVGEDVNQLLTGMSPDGSEMYFDDGAALASVNTSDVLMSGPTTAAPLGYLRRVMGVRRSTSPFTRSTVTVETSEADLSDVLEKGSIDVVSGVPGEPAPPTDLGFGAYQAQAVDANHVDVVFGAPSTDDSDLVAASRLQRPRIGITKTKSFGGHLYEFSKTLHESGANKAWASGYLASTGFFFYLNISVGLSGLTVKTYLEYQEAVRVILCWQGSVSKNIGWQPILPAAKALGTLPLPSWIPGTVTLMIKPEIKGNFTVSSTGGCSFDHGYWLRAGMRVHNGVPSPIKDWNGSNTRHHFAPGVTAVSAYSETRVRTYATLCGGTTLSPDFRPYSWVSASRYHTGTGALRRRVTTLKTGMKVGVALTASFSRWGFDFAHDVAELGPYGLWSKTLINESVADPDLPSRGLPGTTQMVRPAVAVSSGRASPWRAEPARAPMSLANGGRVAEPTANPLAAVAPLPAASPARTVLEPVSLATETVQPEDFSIDGLDVTAATPLPDGSTVRLSTSSQERGRAYEVEVTDGSIGDTSGSAVRGASLGFTGYGRPEVTGASPTTSRTVDITFDTVSDLDASTVEPTDFVVEAVDSDIASVTAADLQPDGKTVRLSTLALLYPAREYRVSVAEGAVSDGSLTNIAGTADFTALAPTLTVSPESTPAVGPERWGSAVRFADENRGYVGLWNRADVLRTDDGGVTWLGEGCNADVVTDFAFRGGDPEKAVLVGVLGFRIAGSPLRPGLSPATVAASGAMPPYNPDRHWWGINFGFPWIGTRDTGGVWTDRTCPIPGDDWFHGPPGSDPVYGALGWFPTNSVDFANAEAGFVNGYPNRLQATSDGGATWTLHAQDSTSTEPSATGIPPARLRFAPGGTVGWAVGHTSIAKTTNGGTTWVTQTTTAPCTSEGLQGLHVHDSQTAWAVGGNGTILHTSNGGAKWLPQASAATTQTLRGVSFADRYNGYAVGDDIILHTWDGGETWTRIADSGTYFGVATPRLDRAFIVGRGPAGHALERIEALW